MKNEDKIIELLAEMVHKQDEMVKNQSQMVKNQNSTNERLERLESQMIKLNVQTVENTRAIIKLADRIEDFAEHEKRIQNLEKAVFKA